jgi:Protein of unknown function with HXXEE motif
MHRMTYPRLFWSHAQFERLQWAFPVAVTLHSFEEAIWFPAWAAGHSAQLPWQVTAMQFRLGLVLITAFAWFVTWLSRKRGPQSSWTYVFISYVFAMLVNVVVPHVSATILFRGYTPGVVTAVTVNLPVTTALLARVFEERIIPSRTVATLVFGIPPGIALAFAAPFLTRLP